MSPADRRRTAVLVLYVVPLLASAAFLLAVGLPVLAVGLLAVEACVVSAVTLSRRRPARPAVPRDGAQVLLALVGVAVVGAVAVVLLTRLATP